MTGPSLSRVTDIARSALRLAVRASSRLSPAEDRLGRTRSLTVSSGAGSRRPLPGAWTVLSEGTEPRSERVTSSLRAPEVGPPPGFSGSESRVPSTPVTSRQARVRRCNRPAAGGRNHGYLLPGCCIELHQVRSLRTRISTDGGVDRDPGARGRPGWEM